MAGPSRWRLVKSGQNPPCPKSRTPRGARGGGNSYEPKSIMRVKSHIDEMREFLNINGCVCIVCAAILLIAQVLFGPTLHGMGPIDMNSPGSGIGFLAVWAAFIGGGFVVLIVSAAGAGQIVKNYYPRLPAKVQAYGPIGFILFLLPFATFWWFFIRIG